MLSAHKKYVRLLSDRKSVPDLSIALVPPLTTVVGLSRPDSTTRPGQGERRSPLVVASRHSRSGPQPHCHSLQTLPVNAPINNISVTLEALKLLNHITRGLYCNQFCYIGSAIFLKRVQTHKKASFIKGSILHWSSFTLYVPLLESCSLITALYQ